MLVSGSSQKEHVQYGVWVIKGLITSDSLLSAGIDLDQIHETKCHEVLTRTAFLAEDINAEINLGYKNPCT